jgi:ATP-dependent protease ClpP protease subunit
MTAKENDDVSILINTPGGSVLACRAIIAAMRACSADVNGILYGQAASCGAIIAINCDKLIVGEYAQLMFHGSSSMGANGNTQELTEGLTGMIDLVKELTRPAVEKKFLTEEEFNNAFDKKCDVFISYEQLKQRGVVS